SRMPRAQVFCAPCCSQKSRLRYMENKEARVCIRCHTHIDKACTYINFMSASACIGSPNPNNPAEYCSTLPPLQQARAAGTLASPPPTVMVPVSALKHPGQDGSQREPRRVWFADGILPNGEVADATILSGTPGTPVPGSSPPPTPPPAAAAAQDPGLPISLSEVPESTLSNFLFSRSEAPTGSPVGKGLNLIPDDDEGLPPILISSGVKGDYSVEERPSPGLLVAVLEEAETRGGGGGADAAPVVFVLNANLLVSLRIINYVNRRCWVFATRGMHAVGQAEVVVLLQCLPDEKTVPKDVFHSLLHVYTDAYKAGKPVGHLGHSFLGRGFLGSREHGGFLFVSPAMQALPACELPPQPLLFALLIQKWEAPWAKVFPIRLMLRLGAEFRFYPCPLFSVRFRKPLFGETGHTIMNLLADFRNYQYSLPTVPGLVVSMEMGHTWIDIPSNRYNQMVKVLNGANEHVLAFGAVFNSAADSHLVCVQNDDGNYQTQAINIHATPRKVTGASFVVFNGALKSSSGFLAKSSIVADGLMVQITAEGMEALRSALREMRDHTLVCGRADGEPPREHVHARWVADDAAFNRGVTSPIDGRSMEGVPSVKIFQGSEFKGSGKIIRWTKEEEGVGEGGSREGGTSTFDPADHSRVAEAVARAFCVALAPRLKELREDGLTQLGLRLTLHSEQVGYQAGGNGQPLPVQYMNELDCALIPIMHGGGGGGGPGDGAVRMELVFSIMENVS
uniref:Zinc finger FYVE-type containing 9 n=1 Tax=Petromyzon marinus TaxID=7757 RepID=S4R651_PETMA